MSSIIRVEGEAQAAILVASSPVSYIKVEPQTSAQILVGSGEDTQLILVEPEPEPTLIEQDPVPQIVVQEQSTEKILVFSGLMSVSTAGGGGTSETLPNRTQRDTVSPQYIYVGFSSAAIGSENESAAEWKIYRYNTITDTSLFADGDAAFDNVWDDRQSLTYV